MLTLFSMPYHLVTNLRNQLFDAGILRSYRSRLPVISVGNLTAGGNGKTPLTLFLVKKLLERGMKPVILSRGYGGKCKGPHIVDAEDSPGYVGDEPLLLSREAKVPVVVSRSRSKGARLIEEKKLGDIIVLDDGFQHRWLSRSVDIICVDVSSDEAIERFCEGKMLPVGRFREDRDIGLSRADIVVLVHRVILDKVPQPDPRILRLIPDSATVYRAYLTRAALIPSAGQLPLQPGAGVALVAAIANPESFEQSVKKLGFSVISTSFSTDHHVFSDADIEMIRNKSTAHPVICTTKDFVKLQCAGISNLYVLEAQMAVTPEDAFVVDVLRHTTTIGRAP